MAVPARLIEVIEPKTCKYGHEMTDANTALDKGHDGVYRPRCRVCKRDSVARSRANHGRPETLPPLYSRRTGRIADDAYATRRLFELVPRDLRANLARVLMDDRTDPLQKRVLNKCIEKRAWAGTNEDVAARLFVEAVLAQTIDARSGLLRADRILGLALG